MPPYKLPYIKPRDWAYSTNDLWRGCEFELCSQKSQKEKKKKGLFILVMSYFICLKFGSYSYIRMLLAFK